MWGRGSLLLLPQRTGGKNDKEKESRKVKGSGEKGEEQRGREGARGSAGRGGHTAVSFWEEKQKVTVTSQGAAASGLLRTCSLDSAPEPAVDSGPHPHSDTSLSSWPLGAVLGSPREAPFPCVLNSFWSCSLSIPTGTGLAQDLAGLASIWLHSMSGPFP